MALAAVMIGSEMGRPILFRQQRPGLRGRPFEVVKFRSMSPAFGPDGGRLAARQRINRLGLLLRRTSIDELPELWNIIKGDMSLVGPRPLLMDYLPRYDAEQARRHEVKPGLTGLAQINGRQELDWARRFEHDVWYVDHWSLGLDLRILAATVREVIRGEGVPPPTDESFDPIALEEAAS